VDTPPPLLWYTRLRARPSSAPIISRVGGGTRTLALQTITQKPLQSPHAMAA